MSPGLAPKEPYSCLVPRNTLSAIHLRRQESSGGNGSSLPLPGKRREESRTGSILLRSLLGYVDEEVGIVLVEILLEVPVGFHMLKAHLVHQAPDIVL